MTENDDKDSGLTLEHRTLIQLRQVLAAVVRDVTPSPGRRNPLSPKTIEDLRDAFALIAARERELRDDSGNPDLPVHGGKRSTTRIVKFDASKDESS